MRILSGLKYNIDILKKKAISSKLRHFYWFCFYVNGINSTCPKLIERAGTNLKQPMPNLKLKRESILKIMAGGVGLMTPLPPSQPYYIFDQKA